jgi:hypothetical protein
MRTTNYTILADKKTVIASHVATDHHTHQQTSGLDFPRSSLITPPSKSKTVTPPVTKDLTSILEKIEPEENENKKNKLKQNSIIKVPANLLDSNEKAPPLKPEVRTSNVDQKFPNSNGTNQTKEIRPEIVPEKKPKIEMGTSSSRMDSKQSSAARPGSNFSSGMKEGGLPFEMKSFGGKDRSVGFTGDESNLIIESLFFRKRHQERRDGTSASC